MPEDISVKIEQMQQRGWSNNKIIENLKNQGYTPREIHDAFSSSEINPDNLEAPSPESEEMQASEISQEEESGFQEEIVQEEPKRGSYQMRIPARESIEDIEEIAESIIEEKWNEIDVTISDFNLWKEKTTAEIEAIKQEILRIRHSFENLQASVIGKVETYNKNLIDIDTELKALGKVFEKIIQPLTYNVKELSRITESLKSKK